MKKRKTNLGKRLFPTPQKTAELLFKPAKPANVPEELRKLDNTPLAALKPEHNETDTTDHAIKLKSVNQECPELNLHSDGTVLKYANSSRPPAVILLDGAGRQVGIICNADVADLVVNGVNSLHLAHTMMLAEDQKKRADENLGGSPPSLLLPPTTTDITGPSC